MDKTSNAVNSEQRTCRRVRIPEQPRVTDAHSGSVVGQLVNLSIDGLMIASSRCITRGSVRQFHIPLSHGDQSIEISVGAEALWCEDAHDSGIWWTGFHIIDISPEHRAILQALTDA